MVPEKQKILLDCERMKYANTGLYHFCLQLCNALQTAISASDGEALYVYTNQQASKAFSQPVNYIEPKFWHKWYLPLTKKFSVWHATHQSTDYFPARTKTPIVLTIHDLNFLYDSDKNTQKQKRYLQALQHKIDNANHIIAISKYVKKDILQHCDVKNKPISVIYNGCNINETGISQAPNYLPQQPFLFTIGTVTAKKNFHVLPCLLANNNRCLVIAGIVQSELYKQKIIAEAEKYNVADRVIFTGPISENDKQWYYQHCEAFVFPSLAEGFGLPVIEAMYFGKPAILSIATSLPEIGGKEAYYFQTFEPAAMQQTLAESLQHYQATNPSENIKKRAATFSWQKAAQQYLEVYRSLY